MSNRFQLHVTECIFASATPSIKNIPDSVIAISAFKSFVCSPKGLQFLGKDFDSKGAPKTEPHWKLIIEGHILWKLVSTKMGEKLGHDNMGCRN